MIETKFQGIFKQGQKIFTENLTPGIKYFDEDLVKSNGKEYRSFDPRRSKLAASILKSVSQTGLCKKSTVLYLGASHGYTSSFVSDIVGKEGFVFAIDFAPRVVRDLVFLCEKRKNIAPIMADVNHPKAYESRITMADFLYQDVAQKNQAEIFIKNLRFLKKGCFGFLTVKSRSIDITKKPKQIFQTVRKQLENATTIVDFRILDPFEKDHCCFIIKK